jgi:flagellar protein FlaG
MSELSSITLVSSVKIQATVSAGEVKKPMPVVDTNLPKNEIEQLATAKAVATRGNKIFQLANRNLNFQIDDTTKHIVIKVVDSETGELIRQIPTAEMLDFMKRMKELEGNSGSLLEAKA